MESALRVNRNLLVFGIPVALFCLLIWMIQLPVAEGDEMWSMALTADLLFVVPLAYFLLIRRTSIPNNTVIPVLIIGILIGSYLLPSDRQTYIALFKVWVLPGLELFIVGYVVFKVRMAVREYRKLSDGHADFFTTLKKTCDEMLPKPLVPPVVTEIAMFYYGFLQWKRRSLAANEFTYHKNSGTPALLGALIFIIAVETIALHVLLIRWVPVLAWILTILSTYTSFQIFGMARSLPQRPIIIGKDSLILRYGIFNETTIPFKQIATIERSSKTLEKDPWVRKLSPLGELEGHSVVLTLKKERELVGLYGMKKKFKVLGFYLDEPEVFLEKLKAAKEG